MSRKISNRVGSPVRGYDFFGQEKFVNFVWQKILHGNVLLVAPKRFGKTSVMYSLIDNPRDNSKIIHADLESVSEPADMIIQLLEGLAKDESFDGVATKIGFLTDIWNVFKSNFEEVDIYLAKVKLRETLREDWQTKGKEIFQKVSELDSTVIFLLDEFPMMLDAMVKRGKRDDAKSLLRWFRSLRISPDLQNRVRFMIAGSIGIDHVLNELGEIKSINDFEKVKLAPFSPSVAHEFLDILCARYSLPLDDEMKSQVLQLIGTPVPYFIQIFFSKIHETRLLEEIDVTTEIIDKIYREKVLGVDCKTYFEYYYQRLKDYYEPDEEKAARGILRNIAVKEELQKTTCYQTYRKIIGKKANLESFSSLMTELENDFYVIYEPETDSYQFGSKLLRDWWLRHYGMTL